MRRTARNVVLDIAELSDPGLDPAKQVNEDASAFLSTELGHLAVVCDGMGGHADGREASQLAVRTILEHYQGATTAVPSFDLLRAAIETANFAVHTMGGEAPADSRPGATCVAVLVAEPGALVAHVGDSRALLVRGDGVYPLTRDHSMVQQLVDAGIIPPHEAASHPDANRITRALGMASTVEVEVTSTWQPLRTGDVLLLMTDGVSDLVEAHELRDIVRERLTLGPAVICQEIIRRANARGGHDNATIQVLQVLTAPERRERTTLDDVPGVEPSDPRTLVTYPASQTVGVTPTVIDEDPHSTGRATEPNLAPPRFGPPPVAPLPRPVSTSPIRTGLLIAAGAALLVGLTAALALFVRHMRSKEEPVAAPIAVEPEPSSAELGATELVADPEPPPPPESAASAPTSAAPEPVPSSQASASAPGPTDAGAPAVPPDGGAGRPSGSVTLPSR